MISLDQVLLLEQKVESAVKKITQLQAENDALRSKCAELTNALSSKSEQLSSFEQDQNRIESGILQALNRLSSIENSVLKAAGQISAQNNVSVAEIKPQNHDTNNFADVKAENKPLNQTTSQDTPSVPETFNNPAINTNFSQMDQVPSEDNNPPVDPSDAPDESESGQFDIF